MDTEDFDDVSMIKSSIKKHAPANSRHGLLDSAQKSSVELPAIRKVDLKLQGRSSLKSPGKVRFNNELLDKGQM